MTGGPACGTTMPGPIRAAWLPSGSSGFSIPALSWRIPDGQTISSARAGSSCMSAPIPTTSALRLLFRVPLRRGLDVRGQGGQRRHQGVGPEPVRVRRVRTVQRGGERGCGVHPRQAASELGRDLGHPSVRHGRLPAALRGPLPRGEISSPSRRSSPLWSEPRRRIAQQLNPSGAIPCCGGSFSRPPPVSASARRPRDSSAAWPPRRSCQPAGS